MKRRVWLVMGALMLAAPAWAQDDFYWDVEYECKVRDGSGKSFEEKDAYYERALDEAFRECERKSYVGGCRAEKCKVKGEVNPYPSQAPYPDRNFEYECKARDAAGKSHKDKDEYLVAARENAIDECMRKSMVGGCRLEKCEIKGEFYPSY